MADADRAPLGRLTLGEAAQVLRLLLRRHRKLVAEAEALADAVLNKVKMGDVAKKVELAVEEVGYDDLAASAAPHDEAPWEVLGPAVDPFLQKLKRRISIGRQEDALALCQGVILGLYRVRESEAAELLPLAREFPAEAAREVFEVWSRGTRRFPIGFLRRVGEWKRFFHRRVTRG